MDGDQDGWGNALRSHDMPPEQAGATAPGTPGAPAAPPAPRQWQPPIQPQAQAWTAAPGAWQPPSPWRPLNWELPPEGSIPPLGAAPQPGFPPYPQYGQGYADPVFHPARRLATIASVLLAVSGVIALVQAIHLLTGVDLQGRINTFHASQADADSYNRMLITLDWVSVGATIVCGLAFMRWLWRSMDNAIRLDAGYGIESPRMSVIAWFIPIYSQVRPYQIVIDLHDRLLYPLVSSAGRWLIRSWWALWLLGSIAGQIVLMNLLSRTGTPTGSDRLVTMALLAVTAAFRLADAVLAIAVVRQVQRLSDARELAKRGRPNEAIALVTTSQRPRVTRIPAALAAAAVVAFIVPLGVVFSSAAAPQAWVQYQPSDKSFSVSMPGAPMEKPVAPHTVSGMTVSGDVIQSGESGSVAFVLSYFDYPKGSISSNPTQALKGMQSALASSATIEAISDRSVNGRPGRDITTKILETNVRMIACVDGDRVYVAEADYMASEAGSPDIDRFLDSFTLP
jgi:hypothetical protein